MSIQISGTTVIDNNKQIQNIGGKGGIISGTFTVSGSGFGTIACNTFRGHVIGFVSFDTNSSSDQSGSMSCALGWSIGNSSNTIAAYNIRTLDNNTAFVSSPTLNIGFKFTINNGYTTTKTLYYTFWYSGSTVPTITIT